jgi:hypothetical protein
VPGTEPSGAGSDRSVPLTKSAPIDEKRTLPESFRDPIETRGVRAPQSLLNLRSAEERQKSTLCPIGMKFCMVIHMDMPNNRKMQKLVID